MTTLHPAFLRLSHRAAFYVACAAVALAVVVSIIIGHVRQTSLSSGAGRIASAITGFD